MAYMLYSLSVLVLLTVALLFLFRAKWLPYLPDGVRELRNPAPGFLPDLSYYNPFRQNSWYYTQLPTTFHGDAEAGLTSSNFDLAENIGEGDSRGGLDAEGKRQVQKIMKRQKVGFDEARRLFIQERFKKSGVGEDGIPRDPKFVSFS